MTFDKEANSKKPVLHFRDGNKLHTALNNRDILFASHMTAIPVETLEIFRKEEHWEADPDAPEQQTVPIQDRKAVGLGEIPCPICIDHKNFVDVHEVGRDTGLRRTVVKSCPCAALKLYHSRWSDPRNIPTMYQDVEYAVFFFKKNLVKRDQLRSRIFHGAFKDEVTLILNTIDQFQDAGFLFTGKGGCGKTTLSCAMYQRDLANWAEQIYDKNYVESVWRVSAKTLADEFQAWALRFNTDEQEKRRNQTEGVTTRPPTVTKDKIERAVAAGLVPCLYLEEVDKFKNSDFQLTQFHSIIDTIQTNGGRVIATSNLPLDELARRYNEQYAEACIRRICGAPKGVHIEFTAKRAFIHINYPDDEKPGLPYEGRAGVVNPETLSMTVVRAKDLKNQVVAAVEERIKTGVEVEREQPLSNSSSVPQTRQQPQRSEVPAGDAPTGLDWRNPPKRRSVHRG